MSQTGLSVKDYTILISFIYNSVVTVIQNYKSLMHKYYTILLPISLPINTYKHASYMILTEVFGGNTKGYRLTVVTTNTCPRRVFPLC